MKKNMLNCKTLDRFEAEYSTDGYTDHEIERIEEAANVANMNRRADWTENDIFAEFLRVLKIDKVEIKAKAADMEDKAETIEAYHGYTLGEVEDMIEKSGEYAICDIVEGTLLDNILFYSAEYNQYVAAIEEYLNEWASGYVLYFGECDEITELFERITGTAA